MTLLWYSSSRRRRERFLIQSRITERRKRIEEKPVSPSISAKLSVCTERGKTGSCDFRSEKSRIPGSGIRRTASAMVQDRGGYKINHKFSSGQFDADPSESFHNFWGGKEFKGIPSPKRFCTQQGSGSMFDQIDHPGFGSDVADLVTAADSILFSGDSSRSEFFRGGSLECLTAIEKQD